MLLESAVVAIPYLEQHLARRIDEVQRREEVPLSHYSWCNGLPGVALALMEWVSVAESQCLQADRALSTRRILYNLLSHLEPRLPHDGKDIVCCGNWGVIDVLIDGANLLGEPEFMRAAQNLAAKLLGKNGEAGDWSTLQDTDLRLFNPGLFQGYAGIGHTLLRLDPSHNIPSVLRFA